MSIGGLIGAVAGGVIGFIIGGPTGALYGASLGFTLGMVIDPITPDIPTPGTPDPGVQVMSGEVGTPIADLTGTAKIIGHLLCYGRERAVPIYSQPSGGGGGKGGVGSIVAAAEAGRQVTGYKYYMSWAVGIVAGEADTLYVVYKNDEVVWEGELNRPTSGGEETITLEGMGSATFYFGTNDHALNSKIGALLDDSSLNTPYRHLCWCFLDDCCIGEYNRTPSMKFMVKKIPSYSFSSANTIQRFDCNPTHSMWYILHNLLGLPESWLNSDDFKACSDSLAVECRGVSVLFDRQQNALNYLESINAHVDSILRYGIDGKFHPKLIRDDYTVGDLPTVDENVMLEEPSFDRRSWIDTLNEMKVQYSEIISVIRSSPKGYAMGGYGITAVIEDLIFSNETSQAISATLDTAKYYGTGVSGPYKGYIMGGGGYPHSSSRTAVIEDLIFSSETSQAITATLSIAKWRGAGVSGTYKGYMMGGDITVKIEDLHFTSEMSQVISATLNSVRWDGVGVNSLIKGYVMGASNLVTIEDLIFSNETSQAIATTLSICHGGASGVSSSIKGYTLGGYHNPTDRIESLIFSSEVTQVISATLSVGKHGGAGVVSLIKGYMMGGYRGNNLNVIEYLKFSDEITQVITATLDTAKSENTGVQGGYI